MTEKLFALFLIALFPATLFAEVRVPKFRAKTRIKRTQPAPTVRGGGITERGPLTGAQVQGPITRGMQQGILRRMEVETSKARIPATRSNPRFEWGRKFREQREAWRMFKGTVAGPYRFARKTGRDAPIYELIHKGIRSALIEAKTPRFAAKGFWAEKEKVSEHEFYFHIILKAFIYHAQFTAEQLINLRAFYEKAVSHPEVFTSDIAFADALSASIGISFVGDAYLAEKIFSLAKQAPEGKRFLTDFVVVRSLLNLERYDLVEELMNFRQGQEGWFKEGKFVGGETVSVYEEVKLYQQTIKDIPVTFSEQLPARNKCIFLERDEEIIDLIENRPLAMMFTHYLDRLASQYPLYPEDSAEGLEKFLYYKNKDLSKPRSNK